MLSTIEKMSLSDVATALSVIIEILFHLGFGYHNLYVGYPTYDGPLIPVLTAVVSMHFSLSFLFTEFFLGSELFQKVYGLRSFKIYGIIELFGCLVWFWVYFLGSKQPLKG